MCRPLTLLLPILLAATPLPATATTVRVHFATNRNPLPTIERFGPEQAELAYGYCDVDIPGLHRPGRVERPALLIGGPVDAGRHVVISTFDRTSADAFHSELDATDSTRILLVVHGHAVRFPNAIRQAAVMAHDIGFDGPVVVFSWPTRGVVSIRDYRADELALLCSLPSLGTVLRGLDREHPGRSLNVVAHSLGCRLVVPAALSVAIGRSPHDPPLVDELVLAAADVDAEAFTAIAGPHLGRIGRRTTLYCSQRDLALGISERLHPEGERLGRDGASALPISVVDLSNVEEPDTFGFGHSLHRTSPLGLRDLRYVVNGHSDDGRGPVVEIRRGGATRWVLGASEVEVADN